MFFVDEEMDDVTRQIVPADFSFLSKACDAVTEALSRTLEVIVGMDSNQVVVLGAIPLTKKKTQTADVYQFTLGEGIVMYDRKIYHLPKYMFTGTKRELGEIHFVLSSVVVKPSPVLDVNLQANVNVHKKRTVIFEQMSDELPTFTINDIQGLSFVSEEALSVQAKEWQNDSGSL